jgi:hypothetical protein
MLGKKKKSEQLTPEQEEAYANLCEELRRADLPSRRIEAIFQELEEGSYDYTNIQTAHELIAINPNTPPSIIAKYLFSQVERSVDSWRIFRKNVVIIPPETVFKNAVFPLLLIENPNIFLFPEHYDKMERQYKNNYLEVLHKTNVPGYFAAFLANYPDESVKETALLHFSHGEVKQAETWLQDLVNQLFASKITPEEAREITSLELAPPAWEPYVAEIARAYEAPYASWEEAAKHFSEKNKRFADPNKIYIQGFREEEVVLAYPNHPKTDRKMLLYLARHANRSVRCAAYQCLGQLSPQEKNMLLLHDFIFQNAYHPALDFSDKRVYHVSYFLFTNTYKSIYLNTFGWPRAVSFLVGIIKSGFTYSIGNTLFISENKNTNILAYIAVLIGFLFSILLIPLEVSYMLYRFIRGPMVKPSAKSSIDSVDWHNRLAMAFRPDLPKEMRETLKNDTNIYVRKVAHEVEKDPKLLEKLFALTPQVPTKNT